MRSFATVLLALSLPLHAFASHQINHRRHANFTLSPRQGGSKFTYYDITTGSTACGGTYSANDFVVALNADQFGDVPGKSAFCGASITITCNGKTTNAVVVDKCPVCPPQGLDLTQGLFEFFAPISDGVIYGSWTGGPGQAAPQAPAPPPPPPPPPTTSYTPPPTTHYDPPTTSQQSTYSPPPSSTSSSTTSTTSKASSSVSSAASTTSQQSSSASNATQAPASYNNAPASSLAQPSGTVAPGQNQAVNNLYEAMIGLGTVVMALSP